MKINVIKAISDYRLFEFEPMYIEGMSSKNSATEETPFVTAIRYNNIE